MKHQMMNKEAAYNLHQLPIATRFDPHLGINITARLGQLSEASYLTSVKQEHVQCDEIILQLFRATLKLFKQTVLIKDPGRYLKGTWFK